MFAESNRTACPTCDGRGLITGIGVSVRSLDEATCRQCLGGGFILAPTSGTRSRPSGRALQIPRKEV